jgi:hypothetical protein
MHKMLEGQSLPDNPSSTASTLLAVLLPRSHRSRQLLEALLMIYALLSEVENNNLSLSHQSLTSLGSSGNDTFVLSFLLAESHKDYVAIYHILDHNIRLSCLYKNDPRDSQVLQNSGVLAILGRTDWLARYFTMRLHGDISVLRSHIQHTDLCKLAYSKINDVVLPVLLHVFSYTNTPDFPFTITNKRSRNMILRGIDQYLEEHQAITQRMCSVIDIQNVQPWSERDLTASTIPSEADLLLPENCIELFSHFPKEYQQASDQLKHKGRVRRFWSVQVLHMHKRL